MIKDNIKYIYICISILSLIATYLILGISIPLIIILLLWIYIFISSYLNILPLKILEGVSIWILISVVIFFNILSVTLLKPKATQLKPLTKEQCEEIYNQYNQKTLDISGDNIKGTVHVDINKDDCKANVTYNLIYTLQLDKNSPIEGLGYNGYKYVGGMRNNKEDRKNNIGTGEIFPVYTNKDMLPTPEIFGTDIIEYSTDQVMNNQDTNTFYQGWKNTYSFREDSLERIMSKNIYEIMDSSKYIERTEYEGGVYSNSINTSKASSEGNVVKTFNILYTER